MSSIVYWLSIASLLWAQAADASDPHWRRTLLQDEWPGGAPFIAALQRDHVETCPALDQAAKRYRGVPYIERRILMTRTLTHCPTGLAAARTFLKSSDPLLREAAVQLAATLPPDQRHVLRSSIQLAATTEADGAVRIAISNFLSTPSSRAIASPPRKK